MRSRVFVLAVFATVSWGCTANQMGQFQQLASGQAPTVASAQQQDVQQGTVGGAATGAVIGGVLGKQAADDSDKFTDAQGAALGAIVGGGLGGLAGRAMGEEVADRRGSYANDVAALDAAIARVDAEIVQLESQIETVGRNIQTRRTELASATNTKGEIDWSTSKKTLALRGVDADVAAARIAKRRAEENIETLRAEIAYASDLVMQHPTSTELTTRRDLLAVRRDRMQVELTTITDHEVDLVVQRGLLAGG